MPSPLGNGVDRPLHPARQGSRYVLCAIFANVALAFVKGMAGVLGHSYALVADALESLLDVFQSLVVYAGLHIAAVPPDDDHPYGHGKAEPLAAVVISLGLLLGALIIAIQSVREILTPHRAPYAFTLVVLVAVVVIKETLFRILDRVGRRIESNAVKSDAWHHRSDALTSIAAFVGISIALIGGKGYEAADDWAALLACGIIAWNGFRLLKPTLNELMDAAPDPSIERDVRLLAMQVEGVVGLDSCWVRKMGFEYFVDLHVEVDGNQTVREGHEIAHRVKDAIRKERPQIRDVLIHVEPGARRPCGDTLAVSEKKEASIGKS
ncbi:MAG: cation efflux system protein [Candidatus Hydrogenedentota bacterium]